MPVVVATSFVAVGERCELFRCNDAFQPATFAASASGSDSLRIGYRYAHRAANDQIPASTLVY